MTSKMIQLLGALRKEMNGAVADSMYYYGDNYGLNYGVSLPTVRSRAVAVGKDHEFAKYLYKQQVRELRLAALHIADATLVDCKEAEFWAEGVINSEIAEEMAFALLRHTKELSSIFDCWTKSGNKFLAHAAMMAAARSDLSTQSEIIERVAEVVEAFPEERIIAQSAVALLAAVIDKHLITPTEETNHAKELISKTIETIPQCSAREYIEEEMAWRMEL
ncbi:MAG: DNA alkylation repair protein [Alistipes sp.]|nr:DNA alkylation repair protein [Alistipes sp.]